MFAPLPAPFWCCGFLCAAPGGYPRPQRRPRRRAAGKSCLRQKGRGHDSTVTQAAPVPCPSFTFVPPSCATVFVLHFLAASGLLPAMLRDETQPWSKRRRSWPITKKRRRWTAAAGAGGAYAQWRHGGEGGVWRAEPLCHRSCPRQTRCASPAPACACAHVKRARRASAWCAECDGAKALSLLRAALLFVSINFV